MNTTQVLERRLGLPAAVMMGLGSILGTGVFVSIGLGAGIAGSGVIIAIVVAAGLAVCNGLSSAQLAAAHPVSGGSYEYGYRLLHPTLGFTAGWMFLTAKSASAATAALGFAGYLFSSLSVSHPPLVPMALAVIAALTVLVLSGLRRTSTANTVIVTITVTTLTLFIVAGAYHLMFGAGEAPDQQDVSALSASWERDAPSLFHAAALMFVAYTGYGRIATLGEEVRDPRRTIPLAILMTLVISAVLYLGVGIVGVAAVGAPAFHQATQQGAAPLTVIAREFRPWLPHVVSLGAITAMLGVLLNLILGLSRVVLAMARRGDLPKSLAHLTADTQGQPGDGGEVRGLRRFIASRTPLAAVMLVAAIIAALAALGSVKAAWSFSAFSVLIYYGITNLAALRLPPHQRLYPRIFPLTGLVGCFGLAFFVEWHYWAMGLTLIGLGLIWHFAAHRRRGPQVGQQQA